MHESVKSSSAYTALVERLKQIADLNAAGSVLFWDREVNMPAAAGPERASQYATLERLSHELFTADEVGGWIEELAQAVDLDALDDASSLVRVVKQEYERKTKLPAEFVARFAEAKSNAADTWRKAHADSDFARFEPSLAQIVELAIESAELRGYTKERYDALLDVYEPDTPTDTVQRAFDELKAALVPLIKAIAERPPVEDAFLYQVYDKQKQWDFGLEILRAIGYDLDRGRQDYSTHPFTIGISPSDVRITTYDQTDLMPGLMATIHEGGHGIHVQGLPSRYAGTPLWNWPGLGLAESQSRMFENIVGRSRPFWEHHYPRLQQSFPQQLGKVSLDRFYRAINRVTPSLIRVEADELTYHLHIILRFELERALVSGDLAVRDLPDAWNARMSEYLGIVPPSDKEGVLQDIHWSIGHVGYFPTYSLGSVLASQLYDLAVEERPEITAELAQGRCDALRAWMIERVYEWGAKLSPPQLVERVTGEAFQVRSFVKYATTKYSELYDL